jgi:hypothetical protein
MRALREGGRLAVLALVLGFAEQAEARFVLADPIVRGRVCERWRVLALLSFLPLVTAGRAAADRFVYPSPGSPVYHENAISAGTSIEVETGTRISGSLRSNGDVDLKTGSTVTGDVAATR